MSSSSSSSLSSVRTVDPNTHPYLYFGLNKHSDGSISRVPQRFPFTPPSPQPNPDAVLSKDLPINPNNKTWARLYLPESADPAAKLPLIVYFHGGGLVAGSVAVSFLHQFCCEIAREIHALVVAVEYRLCPEHRLPAAYDDGVEALQLVRSSGEEWLRSRADLSTCFLMGSSAGGNIAYHVGLRAISTVDDLLPLKIRGLILQQPFFGGVERTASEIRLVKDRVLPPVSSDVAWDLSLPAGADRDHEYCNPTAAGISPDLVEKMRNQRWKVLVTGYEGDPMIDRHVELSRTLKEKGIDVEDDFRDGGCHGLEHFDQSAAKMFYAVVKKFVLS
ncbi:probable carboxylesterase 120 [Andrographis paniculata]|uniref:probable carboxylesterase 120 n=1 Tax=Andrographis paniculata TaxID=175694 RepID=UPI0021E93A0C|nr:probable carboxylesterase 120 [Andrographis paniculata]